MTSTRIWTGHVYCSNIQVVFYRLPEMGDEGEARQLEMHLNTAIVDATAVFSIIATLNKKLRSIFVIIVAMKHWTLSGWCKWVKSIGMEWSWSPRIWDSAPIRSQFHSCTMPDRYAHSIVNWRRPLDNKLQLESVDQKALAWSESKKMSRYNQNAMCVLLILAVLWWRCECDFSIDQYYVYPLFRSTSDLLIHSSSFIDFALLHFHLSPIYVFITATTTTIITIIMIINNTNENYMLPMQCD